MKLHVQRVGEGEHAVDLAHPGHVRKVAMVDGASHLTRLPVLRVNTLTRLHQLEKRVLRLARLWQLRAWCGQVPLDVLLQVGLELLHLAIQLLAHHRHAL